MQNTTNLTAIATATLARIDDGRKLKARCGLDDDTLKVTIVGLNEQQCDATVRNGDGNYEVFISERVSTCTCKDHERRGVLCKHVASLCFYVLGTTTPEAKPVPFACGDQVQLRGLPARSGKVVCVSQETISVSFPEQGMKLAFTAPYHVVELEQAA